MIAKRVIVVGRVQGVWYRSRTAEEAQRLGVKGWVRNNRNGTVEALVEGEEETVFKLINWMGVGPSLARVDSIKEHDVDPAGYESFDVSG